MDNLQNHESVPVTHPSERDLASAMATIFTPHLNPEDAGMELCTVTLPSLLFDHAATAQDPLIGRVDDIDVDAVKRFAAEAQRSTLRTDPMQIETSEAHPSHHAPLAMPAASQGSRAEDRPELYRETPVHRPRSPRSQSVASSSSYRERDQSSVRGRPEQRQSQSSARGRSQRGRHSSFDPERPLAPSREDWWRELQKRTDRPQIYYSERPAKNPRRAEDLSHKIQTKQKHVAEIVPSPVDMSHAESTKTGWAGKDYRYRTDRALIDKAWREGTIGILMKTRSFKTLFHHKRPMYLVDGKGTAYGLVTDVPTWMYKREAIWDDRNFLEQVPHECIGYRDRCGDRTEDDIEANSRGPHWYNVLGVDRQIKGAPGLTSYHVDHMTETTDLLKPHTAIYRLITYASRVLQTRFPSLADRVDKCAQKLAEQGWEHAKPMFGYWYNFCINCPRPNSKRGVETLPHVDGKNLALMVCMVFVWGNFNSKEKAFLVLWEARLIIELPVGALILFPSSLFIHFNIDLSALHVVTTPDGSMPTPTNSTPLQNVEERGSIVMFNQASMFQLAELGCTVKQAKQAGKVSTSDNSGHIARLPVP